MTVPACEADARRVLAGEEPDARQITVDGVRRPFWDAPAYFQPWAFGFFGAAGSLGGAARATGRRRFAAVTPAAVLVDAASRRKPKPARGSATSAAASFGGGGLGRLAEEGVEIETGGDFDGRRVATLRRRRSTTWQAAF